MMAGRVVEDVLARITANPVVTALLVFSLATAAIAGTSYRLDLYDIEFLRNVLAGAHNTVMEILMVGVIILWLTKIGEKRVENRRYLDEIEDLRASNSLEGVAKIRRNIRKLNANGWNRFNLAAYKLDRIELDGAKLRASNLSRISLYRAKLENVDLRNADLSHADLREANLRGARLDGARLEWTKLDGADLQGASLRGADLSGANVVSVNWESIKHDKDTIFPFANFQLPTSNPKGTT